MFTTAPVMLAPPAAGGGFTYTEVAADDFSGTLGNFTATNADQGGNTSINSGVATSNTAQAITADGGASNVWSGSGSFTDSQRAKCTIKTDFLSSAYFSGVIVQSSTDTNAGRDHYGVIVQHDGAGTKTMVLYKIINGTYTSLASTSATWANDDALWLDFDSDLSTLTAYRNGSSISGLTGVAVGGTPLSGGKPGFIVSSGGSTTSAVDNFSAGNLS